MLLIFIGVVVLLYWFGPTATVEYSFRASGEGKFVKNSRPITLALISDIHYRESPPREITGGKETRDILRAFVDEMTNQVKPEFIVQLGDFNDGCMDDCRHPVADDLILERLGKVREYSEKLTEIPWFNVIGNHEYKSGPDDGIGDPESPKDFSAIYSAIDDEWSSLEDTWYYRDIAGYRFIFLNTAFPHDGPSHIAPPAQVDWLREVLDSSNLPKFVFMHVAISGGTGSVYDLVVNRDEIIGLLAADESFVMGFFGHSHHTDSWDGLRQQRDSAGNLYYHTTAPHEWMGNRSSFPWTIVTIDPDRDLVTIDAGNAVKRSEILEFANYWKQRIFDILARYLGSPV